jgi:hypothetical protein
MRCLSSWLSPITLVMGIGALTACGGGSSSAPSVSLSSSSASSLTPDNRSVSVAHRWNEVLINAIRKDKAHPPVHARNLFHSSAAMYDAWAIYAPAVSGVTAPSPYLLSKTLGAFSCPVTALPKAADPQLAREQAVSFAMYRLIAKRFEASPGFASTTKPQIDALMADLGYDITNASTDYSTGSAAAMGNYIAQCYLNYGLQDGSNEAHNFANQYYTPVNPALEPKLAGNPNVLDIDRWQPLVLVSGGTAPAFLAAEWGRVAPWALREADKGVYRRNNIDFPVYHDPGEPPTSKTVMQDEFKWNYEMVVKWSAQLDPTDGVMLDISPASKGNTTALPSSFVGLRSFYNADGSDTSRGYASNPKTNKAYAPVIVPRGDYVRVLAEFWADGPNSETPPGHWFTLLNQVTQQPEFTRNLYGTGPALGSLEWDVKAYLTLGGAMHDVAITSWGIKSWYDATRPIAAIRALAALGQSSDALQPSYNPKGIRLDPGYIEVVKTGDALAGVSDVNVGKIKVKSWRGPSAIAHAQTDYAGVDWILAENWWPYQRPTFVTPSFAGYISGHSTFSRAAAEVLTALTGDEYFPGGMGQFTAKAHDYLVFEDGPSVDVTLQWATYRDAADQSGLSRIWGGIHPPMDDAPGRVIGIKIANDSVSKAKNYFMGTP